MTTPNQQTVREIARQQILDDRHRAHDNGSAVLGRFGPDGLTRHEYGAYCSAICEAIRTAQITVSWPDEQQPADPVTEDDATAGTCTMDCVMGHTNEPGCLYDTTSKLAEQQPADVVTAEQQQDGAVDLRERVRAWMDGRTDTIDRDDVREIYVVADRASRDLAGAIGELRRVLAERTALAARVAELEGEREADTRAVDAVAAAEAVELLDRAISNLIARFADRIEALDADTDGGAE